MPDKTDKKLESMVQDMMDAKESDANIDAAIHLYKEEQNPTLSELKGVLEGVIPGAWGAVRGVLYDLPRGVIDDTLSVLKGETPEAAKSFVESIAKAPQEFMDATHEERGKMIGNLLGSMGAAKYAPMTPKPIARGVGALAETVGTKGGWPIRMMGAHQLGSGNPMGAAVMALPEVLKKGGATLKKFGAPLESDAAAIEKFHGGPKIKEPATQPVRVMANEPDMWDRAKTAGTTAAPTETAGGLKLSTKELSDLKKAGYSPDVIARMEPNIKPPTAMVSKAPLALVPGSTTPAIRVTSESMGPTLKEPKIPVEGNVPASKSKHGVMSATPGLTVEDAKALGLNPDLPIKGLTPEAIKRLLAERAARSGAYRANAGLDTAGTSAMERDLLNRSPERDLYGGTQYWDLIDREKP